MTYFTQQTIHSLLANCPTVDFDYQSSYASTIGIGDGDAALITNSKRFELISAGLYHQVGNICELTGYGSYASFSNKLCRRSMRIAQKSEMAFYGPTFWKSDSDRRSSQYENRMDLDNCDDANEIDYAMNPTRWPKEDFNERLSCIGRFYWKEGIDAAYKISGYHYHKSDDNVDWNKVAYQYQVYVDNQNSMNK